MTATEMGDGPEARGPWSAAELDAIVADYFDMLAAELARKPYSKAEHNRARQQLIGRKHGSIEFKHKYLGRAGRDRPALDTGLLATAELPERDL